MNYLKSSPVDYRLSVSEFNNNFIARIYQLKPNNTWDLCDVYVRKNLNDLRFLMQKYTALNLNITDLHKTFKHAE